MTTLIKDYTDWLKEETSIVQANDDWQEIITPFLKFNNDNVEVYCRYNEDGTVTFADGKQSLRELEMAGVPLASKSRKKQINNILRAKGVQLKDDELMLTAPLAKASEALHQFVQAALEVLDLHVLSKEKVATFFKEDIEDWFALKEIPYFTNTMVYGKSGLPTTFDFALPRMGNRKETLIQAVSLPRKDMIFNNIMVVLDALEVKPRAAGLIVLNDEKGLKPDLETAIANYNVPFVRFSEKEKLQRLIAA